MNEFYLSLLNRINFENITDHPNILVAAAFWDEDRYTAARICYKYLRTIDDLIDNYKSSHKVIDEKTRHSFSNSVKQWLKEVENGNRTDGINHELIQTVRKFHIPVWPMEVFARSMMRHIQLPGSHHT